MLNTLDKGMEMENLFADTEKAKQTRKTLFRNPRYQKVLKHFLPIWNQRGLLDPLN